MIPILYKNKTYKSLKELFNTESHIPMTYALFVRRVRNDHLSITEALSRPLSTRGRKAKK